MQTFIQKLFSVILIVTLLLAISSCGNKGPLVRPAALTPEVNSIEIEILSSLA